MFILRPFLCRRQFTSVHHIRNTDSCHRALCFHLPSFFHPPSQIRLLLFTLQLSDVCFLAVTRICFFAFFCGVIPHRCPMSLLISLHQPTISEVRTVAIVCHLLSFPPQAYQTWLVFFTLTGVRCFPLVAVKCVFFFAFLLRPPSLPLPLPNVPAD